MNSGGHITSVSAYASQCFLRLQAKVFSTADEQLPTKNIEKGQLLPIKNIEKGQLLDLMGSDFFTELELLLLTCVHYLSKLFYSYSA